jgi:hypothetical protein
LDTCSGWSNPSKVVKLLERDHDRQLEDRPEVNKHFNFIKSAKFFLQKHWQKNKDLVFSINIPLRFTVSGLFKVFKVVL